MSDNCLPSQFNAMAIKEFGAAEVLTLMQLPLPQLDAGQVLVKSNAASINPIDYKTRAGLGWAAQQNADKLPMVLGYDCLGEVVAVADDVEGFNVGDKVLGMVGFPLNAGAYGEYVSVESKDIIKVSGQASSDLAALPLIGLTAMQGLFSHGNLIAGETVVISGASGSVGFLAVQLALAAGANVVALASSVSNPMLEALGDVQVIDYKTPQALSQLSTVNLWFDLVGGVAAISQLELVENVERLVTVPTITASEVCDSVANKGVEGQGMLVSPDINQLTKLVQMVENQQLRLNIAKIIDFKLAANAHQALESGEIKGKVVLEFS
ncbi:NADP-dependent oxidoreductase [Psychrobium sp. 1_MG-2023]|uniref:NADP-dependent oxidoreductase n=1 Tax=Psychrobium sp. 1_MG-2023 TaxID=3062624 RepID=UPI000C33EE5C|nr:NADP-dependent oxidoreductase [Psychrobium sp. 1_MG-2023]MDP2562394.1 NADP-dependent oxidoreductase [Psychrobium sp. 1_MG-2023]PKF55841.1 hypothetical protein CW748_11940 [Alteromonadales bacterium alter-6D02]